MEKSGLQTLSSFFMTSSVASGMTESMSFDFDDNGERIRKSWNTYVLDGEGNKVGVLGRNSADGGLAPLGIVARNISERSHRISDADKERMRRTPLWQRRLLDQY